MSVDELINFTITVGGSKIDPDLYPIVSVVVDKSINKIPYAKVIIHDGDPAQHDFPISNSKLLAIGSEITIQAGYGREERPIFEGVIVKESIQAHRHGTPVLVVDCKDTAYRTTLLPRNTSFSGSRGQGVTDSKVLTDIIGQYNNLTIKVENTSVQHECLAQPAITDWDFILLRAEANGQVVIVDDSKISVEKPQLGRSAAVTFTYGENMHAFEVEMDARAQWQGAVGKVWEPNKQVSTDIKVAEPGEHSFGEVGYSKLSGINKQDPTTLYHSGALAEQEMETLARSLLAFSRISKIRGKITVQGLATVKPGQMVKIDKGARTFQGQAYVTGVHHRITEGDWATELTLGLPNQRYLRKYSDITALPAAGMLPAVHGLQIGIVKKIIEDPQKAYRIFVRLPMVHKSDEGIWCRVASFYASQEAGVFFMPELEDEVVIGFLEADPRSPIILGSLYSAKNKPPAAADKNNSTKTITSKNKLALTFNDQDKEIVLEIPKDGNKGAGRTIKISDEDSTIEIINGEANKIVLGDKNVEIFSKQNISLNAQGSINLKANKEVTLKGNNAVDISGNNVSVSAKMKASVSGKSSTQVSSNATTIVKGAIVKIN
ncbi:MAG: type VI secretion system tip protein VgrG [Bacteroidota bacterium]